MSKALERGREAVKRSRIHKEIVGFTDDEADELARDVLLAFLNEGDEELRREIVFSGLITHNEAARVLRTIRSLVEERAQFGDDAMSDLVKRLNQIADWLVTPDCKVSAIGVSMWSDHNTAALLRKAAAAICELRAMLEEKTP